MARDTAQERRPQSKAKNSQTTQKNAQSTGSTRKSASDRQAPIQTARDEGRAGASSSSAQQSGSNEQVRQQNQQNQQNQRNAHQQNEQSQQNQQGLARRGATAPVRGAATTNPFTLMQRMSEDMDRLFGQFGFGRTGLGLGPSWSAFPGSDISDPSQSFGSLQNLWTPQIETTQRGDRLVVRADLPGVDKDDVHVEVENGVLTISGERRDERKEEREGFFRSERTYGQFFRAIPLPDGARTDECDAKFNDGVLEVSLPLPRQEERKGKRIQIR
jgi:HSP20 family protein